MAPPQVTLEEFNNLDKGQFIQMFANLLDIRGAITVHISGRPFHNIMDIYTAFCNAFDYMDTYRKIGVLRGNPGLLASLEELVGLSEEDRKDLKQCIAQYSSKFGFPFIICHKENKISDIMLAIKRRLTYNREYEIEESIREIMKIGKYHILAMIKHEYA